MLNDFFAGKRILLTGHNGFKGSWMTMMLSYLGAKVCGFALPPEQNGLFKESNPLIYKNVYGDIRHKNDIRESCRAFKPEIVIHFAAHSTLDKGNEMTDYIFETNVLGTVNLLEAVRNTDSVQAVLVITSDKSYKNKESDIPYVEDAELGAQDPYSTSKACQELVADCYRRSFLKKKNIRLATARASNVLGGGDYNLTRLFPSLIDCFINKKKGMIRNPYSIRPWQNVLDVLYGYLLLCKALYETDAENDLICGAYNFGPEEDGFVTVKEIADLLVQLFEDSCYEIVDNQNAILETKILRLNSNKAKKNLLWKPQYSFYQTVNQTVEFAKRRQSGEPVADICHEYIKNCFIGEGDERE